MSDFNLHTNGSWVKPEAADRVWRIRLRFEPDRIVYRYYFGFRTADYEVDPASVCRTPAAYRTALEHRRPIAFLPQSTREAVDEDWLDPQ